MPWISSNSQSQKENRPSRKRSNDVPSPDSNSGSVKSTSPDSFSKSPISVETSLTTFSTSLKKETSSFKHHTHSRTKSESKCSKPTSASSTGSRSSTSPVNVEDKPNSVTIPSKKGKVLLHHQKHGHSISESSQSKSSEPSSASEPKNRYHAWNPAGTALPPSQWESRNKKVPFQPYNNATVCQSSTGLSNRVFPVFPIPSKEVCKLDVGSSSMCEPKKYTKPGKENDPYAFCVITETESITESRPQVKRKHLPCLSNNNHASKKPCLGNVAGESRIVHITIPKPKESHKHEEPSRSDTSKEVPVSEVRPKVIPREPKFNKNNLHLPPQFWCYTDEQMGKIFQAKRDESKYLADMYNQDQLKCKKPVVPFHVQLRLNCREPFDFEKAMGIVA